MPHYVFFVFHFWRVTTKSGSHGVGRRGEKNQASCVVVATASSLRKLPILSNASSKVIPQGAVIYRPVHFKRNFNLANL